METARPDPDRRSRRRGGLLARRPTTAFGRTAALVAGGILVTHVATVLLIRDMTGGIAENAANRIGRQMESVRSALEVLPEGDRDAYLRALGERAEIELADELPDGPLGKPGPRYLWRDIEREMRRWYPGPVSIDLELGREWIWVRATSSGLPYFGMPQHAPGTDFPRFVLVWVSMVVGITVGTTLLFVPSLTQPLTALVEAARALARGAAPPPLPDRGPREVQELSHTFEEMARAVRQAERDRTMLLAGISHDLRTPLTRMRFALELMGDEGDAVREGLEQDVEDMDRTIEQFLAFVRTGRAEEARDGDLGELVREVVEREELFRDRRIELHLDPDLVLPLKPLAMKRLVTNLVQNAIVHGGGEVEVATRRLPGKAWLSVRDRGPGLPADQREALFEAFARGDGARGSHGSGLGLSIVRRIAGLHGGSVELHDRDGGGLEVRVVLPLGREPS